MTADLADKIAGDCEFVSRRISVDTLGSAPGPAPDRGRAQRSPPGTRPPSRRSRSGRFREAARRASAGRRRTTPAAPGARACCPSLTSASRPAGEAPRASDPVVAYDAAHGDWLDLVARPRRDFTGARDQPLARRRVLERTGLRRAAGRRTSSRTTRSGSPATTRRRAASTGAAISRTPISRRRGSRCRSRATAARPGARPSPRRRPSALDAEGALPLIQPDGALTIVVLAEGGMYAVRSTRRRRDVRRGDADRAADGSRPAAAARSVAADGGGRCVGPTARGVGGLRVSTRAATATRSCSRPRTDGTTWSPLDTRARDRASTASFRESRPIRAVPGRISIVMYVRTVEVVQRGDVLARRRGRQLA